MPPKLLVLPPGSLSPLPPSLPRGGGLSLPVSPSPPSHALFHRVMQCSSGGLVRLSGCNGDPRGSGMDRANTLYRVTHLVGENPPLTQFRQFQQLVAATVATYCPGRVTEDGSQLEAFIDEMGHPVDYCWESQSKPPPPQAQARGTAQRHSH